MLTIKERKLLKGKNECPVCMKSPFYTKRIFVNHGLFIHYGQQHKK